MDELQTALNNLSLSPLQRIYNILSADKNIDPEDLVDLMKMIKEALEFGASVDSKSIYDWLNNQPVN
jgi:hypothetical protein